MQAVTITQITPDELAGIIKRVIEPLITQLLGSNYKEQSSKLHYPKKEAAELLSCSVPMIDKLVQQGRLDKVKVGAKVLITADSIDRILNNKKGVRYAK